VVCGIPFGSFFQAVEDKRLRLIPGEYADEWVDQLTRRK